MQSNQVPVVVYENGVRHVVGSATVNVEGKHLAIIADTLPIFGSWDLPENLEVSFKEAEKTQLFGALPIDLQYVDGSDNA